MATRTARPAVELAPQARARPSAPTRYGVIGVGVVTAVSRPGARHEGQTRDSRSAIAPVRHLAYTAAHATAKVLCRALADAAALGLLAPPRDDERR